MLVPSEGGESQGGELQPYLLKGRVFQGKIINPLLAWILHTLLAADPDLSALFVASLVSISPRFC